MDMILGNNCHKCDYELYVEERVGAGPEGRWL